MAKIQFTRQGADELQMLSQHLGAVCNSLEASSYRLKRAVAGLDQLGDFGPEILELAESVHRAQLPARDDIARLSGRFALMADRIRQSLAANGGAVPSTAAQPTDHGTAPGARSCPAQKAGQQTGTVQDWVSDRENAIMKEFKEGYLEGNIKLETPPGGPYEVVLPASEILGVFWTDNTGLDNFWHHHGESKERYHQLAAEVNGIWARRAQGLPDEGIQPGTTQYACWEQYFKDPICVDKYGDNYIADYGGRHRIRLAKELGLEIPVTVFKEAKRK